MLEGDLVYSVISPAMGAIGLLLGLYALKKSPFLKASRVFAGAIGLFFVAGILDFGFRNAPDEGTAVLLAKGVFFLVVIIFGVLLYLSSYLPYERRDNWFREHTLLFLMILLMSGIVAAIFVDGIALTNFGWSMAKSHAIFVFGAIVIAYVVMTLVVLGKAYRVAEGGQVRLQCLLMGVGVAFPIFWASGLTILNLLDLVSFPFLAPGFLVTVVAFTLAIVRYKLFIILPVEESALIRTRKEEAEAKVGASTSHLVEEKTPDAAYDVFLAQIANGSKGLLITRTHPDAVKARHGLIETPIIWLASTPGPDRVDPSNLSILQHTVAEFLRKDDNTIIMLDGIEYLISNNPMEKVLRAVYAIRDEVVIANSRLIVPLDPEVLDESKLALLEREFEITKAG